MKYCSGCGMELKEGAKFCEKCGKESIKREPSLQQQDMQQSLPGGGSKKPLLILLGCIAVIAVCAAAFFVFRGGNEPSVPVSNNAEDTADKSMSANKDEALQEEANASAGKLTVTSVDASKYPVLSIAVETVDMEELTAASTKAYDGTFNVPIRYIQQTESDGTKSKYTIEIEGVESEELEDTKTLKVVFNDVEAAFAYEVPYERENLSFAVHQVDTSNYPEISIYFTMQDSLGEYITVDEPKFFNLLNNDGLKSADEVISSLRTTKENSNLNIALVLDRSGSMDELGNFASAQNMAIYFLDLLNYSKGDSAAVISFDDFVYLDHFFSSNSSSLQNAVRNMYTSGMTALYDALHVSLLEIAGQGGSKCIVALTDGMDNSSSVLPNTVISKARELGIPIYIIGLGDEYFDEARRIAIESGGSFSHITSINEIKDIYDSLFRTQQSQMVVTYTVRNPSNTSDMRDIRLQFKDNRYVGEVHSQFQYQNIINPNYTQNDLTANINNMSEVEKAIYYYEHKFVDAVNSYNFNEIKDHLDPNGSLYETQRKLLENYEKRGVKERLLYYKINSIQQLSDGSYEVVVTEQFYIQIGTEKASYKEFVCTYQVRETANGYKISEMPDLQTINETVVSAFVL